MSMSYQQKNITVFASCIKGLQSWCYQMPGMW